MKVLFMLLFLTFGAGAMGGTKLQAQNAVLDFELVNKTGRDIDALYMSPSQTDDWGDNVMNGDVLKNNGTVSLEFSPASNSKVWDLSVGWVGYSSDDDVVWHDIDLSTVEKITLHYNEKTGETSATFD